MDELPLPADVVVHYSLGLLCTPSYSPLARYLPLVMVESGDLPHTIYVCQTANAGARFVMTAKAYRRMSRYLPRAPEVNSEENALPYFPQVAVIPGLTVATMAPNVIPLVQGFLGLLIVYLLVSLVRFSLLSLRPKNYPPGPPALPFIGNVHHFASSKPYLQFTELRKKYGDIVGLKAGPSNVVVINSAELSRELLEKRGAIYSNRPFEYIPREHIVRGAQHIIFLPHDKYLKEWRTAVRYCMYSRGALSHARAHTPPT